ncbi:DEKNAAC101584 [Brettanomyces naardenensis]|uniref:Maintenance of mitochondrial morphology protein 1 n=1 Tax=Brettanomyces naardenensis TaxID=13370 RepID=A0A448YIK5_BRENA|nr:DEKNAAC101584 [Brettanomyces naardenensis]
MEEYLSSALQSMQSNGEPYTLSLSPELLQGLQSSLPDSSYNAEKYYQSPPVQSSGRGFTHGFMLGQLSVIVIIIIFIRFFVFAEAAPANPVKKRPTPKITRLGSRKNQNDDQSNGGDDNENVIHSILEKTYYDVDNHSPESLDWFNVLVAQLIMQVRREALFNDNIYHSLDKAFNESSLADYTDKINITEVNIGDDFPIFSNCRIQNTEGRLEAKIDVDVSDTLTIAADTSFLINTPKPITASLPVQISVSIVRFSGCLTVSLVSIGDSKGKQEAQAHDINDCEVGGVFSGDTKTALMFSFAPDFRLEFEIKSLIGSKAKLEDMPRIGSLVENILRNWFIDRCIEPRFQTIKIPSAWKGEKVSEGVQETNG